MNDSAQPQSSNRFDPSQSQYILKFIHQNLNSPLFEKKKEIIDLLIDIEEKQLCSVHKLMNSDIIERLKQISKDNSFQELQYSAVQLFASIIEAEEENEEYLITHGILQNIIELLRTDDKTLFDKMIKGLEVFINRPASLDRLVELHILTSLLFNLKSSKSQTVIQESYLLMGRIFHQTLTEIQEKLAVDVLDAFVMYAATSERITVQFYESMHKFCKYAFKHDLHHIFAEKGNIVFIIELFQPYPQIIRLVFKKLSSKHAIMKKIIDEEINYLFAVFAEIIPKANLTLTLAIIEIIRIVLQQKSSKYVEMFWQRDDIIESLKCNLSIEKDITINIFEIYYMLIANEDYERNCRFMTEKGIIRSIVQAVNTERTPEAMHAGLRMIDRMMDFESRWLKSRAIKECVFTKEIRECFEGGPLMERISLKSKYQAIQNIAHRILGRNFVKIEEKVLPIDAVCKKKSTTYQKML